MKMTMHGYGPGHGRPHGMEEGAAGRPPRPRPEPFVDGEGPIPPMPRDGRHGPGPGRPPLPPPEDDTADGRLLHLLRMAGHLAMMRPGLRAGQFRILSLLESGEPVPQAQLAERLHIQPGSLSEILGKLAQAGVVMRQRSEEDRRASTVQITAAGLKQLAGMRQTMDIERSELLSALSDEEKERLTALLVKLVRSAEPPAGGRPAGRRPGWEPGEQPPVRLGEEDTPV